MHGRLFQIIRTDYLNDEYGCYSYKNYEIKDVEWREEWDI